MNKTKTDRPSSLGYKNVKEKTLEVDQRENKQSFK